MGSVGTSTVSREDFFNGVLGERSSEDALTRLQKVQDGNLVNPNYNDANAKEDYRRNCALCTVATVLQAMGYDVEAMPRDVKWRGFDSVFEVDYTNTDNYMLSGSHRWHHTGYPSVNSYGRFTRMIDGKQVTIDNPPRAPKGPNAVARAIEEKVKSWGDGAVGQLSVSWKNSTSSHAITVFNKNGNVVLYDAQSNRVISDIPKYMSRTIAIQTSMVRLDNAKVRSDIKDLNKMVRKRNKSLKSSLKAVDKINF